MKKEEEERNKDGKTENRREREKEKEIKNKQEGKKIFKKSESDIHRNMLKKASFEVCCNGGPFVSGVGAGRPCVSCAASCAQ